jgi:hypothetical protein
LQGSQAVRTKARETADSLTQGIKEAAQTTTRAVKAQASEFTTDVGHELNRVLEQQKARGADAIRHAELDCEPRARAGRVRRGVALRSGPS